MDALNIRKIYEATPLSWKRDMDSIDGNRELSTERKIFKIKGNEMKSFIAKRVKRHF